jgi:ADP-ribosylglycohydrolase
MSAPNAGRHGRALGALFGLAIGDALGMPTQSFSPAEIDRRFGQLAGFVDGPFDQPLAPGMAAGSVTDDTEQAMIVADLLVEGRGSIDPMALASRLVGWETGMRERGSLDLLGPSTARAIAALRAGGAAEEVGRLGATNGAAMRVTPIGIAFDIRDPDRLERAVVQASVVTHNTGLALAGAAAVAAAVSTGINGGGVEEAIAAAIGAARSASRLGYWIAGADVGTRIEWAVASVRDRRRTEAVGIIRDLIGTSLATQESVPAAFAALTVCPRNPWGVTLLAASLGGDCDTIAAMAGAISGSLHGAEGFPSDARALVAKVNGLDLDARAVGLLALR